jgi:hypothetical protein
MCNTQIRWVCGPFQSFAIPNIYKKTFRKLCVFPSSCEEWGTPPFDRLERADLNTGSPVGTLDGNLLHVANTGNRPKRKQKKTAFFIRPVPQEYESASVRYRKFQIQIRCAMTYWQHFHSNAYAIPSPPLLWCCLLNSMLQVRCFVPLTWWWKHIQFSKRCVF